jgi:D-alanyl-D-alanine carboxypeptidase/D-alanyl-D-alanine-endopeptidase (penicillin-binding protein 4)
VAVGTVAIVVRSADGAASPAATHDAGDLVRISGTPLWSPRRIPQVIGVVAVSAARQRFGRSIAAFAAPGRCVAVDGPAGPLSRVAATLPLAPASTEKLLTGAAALSVLGPGHVFTTRVAATAALTGGVIHGDLYLVGGGDPVLATPTHRARLAASPITAGAPTTSLDDLAAGLAAAGVHRIAGAIVADDSRYDTLRSLPTLKPGERSEIGPLGALSVDDGFDATGVPTDDPALLTARSLAPLLAKRGVTVAGPARRGTAPAAARTLASVRSPRLDAIVESMLMLSNNYTAELLVRGLGLAVEGTGSTAAGLRAVTATVGRLGVPTAGVRLVDGSGLSPANRVTCAALLAAIGLGDRADLRALRVGLPVAGRTGTLATRFLGDPLAGRLRAKTGHIDGVVGLAGVVPTAVGQLRFAFLANGRFSEAGGEDLQARIAHLVASYPVVPPPDRLVPAPEAAAPAPAA